MSKRRCRAASTTTRSTCSSICCTSSANGRSARFAAPGETHLTLYRGVNAFEEHQIVERIDKHNVVMRLNNLTSFSSDRDIADCFGDTILTARVPVAKMPFFNSAAAVASA